METCKTAERNLTLKVLYLFEGYKAIKCTNCHLSFRHAIKKRFLGGAIVGIGTFIGGTIMLNLNTTLEYKLLFGIMSSVLYILLLTSVVIIFFRLSKKSTDYALIGIKII
jgi:hypothetical protein